MHVADLKLCKELYELSGWTMTEFYHIETNSYVDAPKDHWGNTKVGDIDEALRWTGKRCPAYDCGYLLRKLPGHIAVQSTTWDDIHTEKVEGQELDYQAVACYQSNIKGLLVQEVALTPEDAVAKLAIELFKQGVLKKGKLHA